MMDVKRSPLVTIVRGVVAAPWLWAAAMAYIFYQAIPHLPVGRELATRYFCSHPLEYVLAGLFFVGLSIVCIKAIAMVFERRAFASVPDFGIDEPGSRSKQMLPCFVVVSTSLPTSWMTRPGDAGYAICWPTFAVGIPWRVSTDI